MHTQPRQSAVTKIVLHDNEGPEGVNSAFDLSVYLHNNGPSGGGYQFVVDQFHAVRVQPDNVVCWANGAVNETSVDICRIGYAAATAAEYLTAYDKGELELMAQQVASWCQAFNIPAVLLQGTDLHNVNTRGITTHGLLTAAGYAGTEGHTDPGPNFPLAAFIARVEAILHPPVVIDWGAIAKIQAWIERLTKTPLKLHDISPDVYDLQAWLLVNGQDAGHGDAYGIQVEGGVARFKAQWALPNRDGAVCGGTCAAALVKHASK